jgi:type IV/VI secretion system ImpK/VasF family protein
MELRDLTRDLFLFTATFRERLDRGQVSGVQALSQEVKGIFGRMDQKARENPAMSARYEKMRYALVGLIDEIVVSSTWPEAQSWPVLELELYQSNIAGDRIYDLIQGLTPADLDLIEGYFYVLALGFRGKYAFDEAKWAETLLQLYRQLPEPMEQGEVKLAPEAYQVIRRKAPRLDPLFSLARSAIVFVVCVILLVVFYQVVWLNSVNEVRKKAEEVRTGLVDEQLELALEKEVGR